LSDCESARLKLARAREHLEAYKRAWADLVSEGQPYGFRSEIDDGRTCITFYLVQGRDIPRRLGLIIGDCAVNLRASLDHLAFALPRKPGTNPSWETESQFPTCDDLTNYPSVVGQRLRGVERAAAAAIKKLQPGYGGNDPLSHPLHMLAELSNRDKHRVVHLVALIPHSARIEVDTRLGKRMWPVWATGGAEHDAAIGKAFFFGGPAPEPVQIKVEVTFGVTVGGIEPPWGVETLLENIHAHIRDKVLPAVEPFIP
jgi:hypothetical protein